MFKKFNHITGIVILMGLFLISIFYVFNQKNVVVDEDFSFLWEIRDNGKKIGVLYGLSSLGKSEEKLPDAVKQYFNESNKFVTEVQVIFPTFEDELEILKASYVPEEDYNKPISERFSLESTEFLKVF